MRHVRSFEEFFGIPPPSEFSNEDIRDFLSYDLRPFNLMSCIKFNHTTSEIVKTVIKDIIAVTKTHKSEESAVDDMARNLFLMFRFDAGQLSVRSRITLKLNMAGDYFEANPDVCIETLDLSIKLLVQQEVLVQEDEGDDVASNEDQEPEAQLIAKAIAAYQTNCKTLYNQGREDEIPDVQNMLGVVLVGTCPTFYVIPVSRAFSDNLRRGIQPNEDMIVSKYMIKNSPVDLRNTILCSHHRHEIMQCFEAFKRML